MASGDYHNRRKRPRKPWLGGDVRFACLAGGAMALMVGPKLLVKPAAAPAVPGAVAAAPGLAPLTPVAASGGKPDALSFDLPSLGPTVSDVGPGEIKPLKAPEPTPLPKLPNSAPPAKLAELPPPASPAVAPVANRSARLELPNEPPPFPDPVPLPAAKAPAAAEKKQGGLPFALPGLPIFGASSPAAKTAAAPAPKPAELAAPAVLGPAVASDDAPAVVVHPYNRQFLERKEYFVRPGESARDIARRLYGAEDRAAALQAANPGAFDAGGMPKPGSTLRLP